MRYMAKLLRAIFGFRRARSTEFSEFIRNASAREKKRVYTEVLIRATERQNAVRRADAKVAELHE